MAALSNILPIVSLGSCCFLLLVLFACRCWRRTSRQRQLDAVLESPDYEVEEIPGTTDFVMVGRKGHRKKKVKKPKLWDIWVPNLGRRPAHERKSSSGSALSDLSLGDDVGHWAELKPISVTYVKNENKTNTPPIPTPPVQPWVGPNPGPTTITLDGDRLMRGLSNSSQSSLSHPPSRDVPPRPIPGPPPIEDLAAEVASRVAKRESVSGYDKSTIEAVQVSVFIAMPQRTTPANRHTSESAGPLELGIVHIPLGHSGPRWAARQSIRPPPP